MKRDYFVFELFKSGPFLLLLILALLIIIGVYLSNHHKDIVQMREDVLYVAPRQKS